MKKIIFNSGIFFGFGFFWFLPFFHSESSNKTICKKEQLELEFDTTLTSFLIHPPIVSGVVDDPNDPCQKFGIFFKISNLNKKNKSFEVAVTSDNQLVVKDEDILIEKLNTTFKIKIKPTGIGYANLMIACQSGKEEASLKISYAASSFEHDTNFKTYWHTGITDASAVLSIDDKYMLVADDEKNKLLLYNRTLSGLPVKEFDYSTGLNLSDGSHENYKEVDCEACVASMKNPNRAYWLGSMSNSETSFKQEPNRNRLFATDITGSGKEISIKTIDYTDNLRKAIIKYGDAKGLELSKSGSFGHSSKVIDGFNLEGMCFAPDSSTLFICCRAPLAPISNRKYSLIIPIQNFEKWFEDGHKIENISFDEPIVIDLNKRGIRDIIRMIDGNYAIIAGNADDKSNFSIYIWNGKKEDPPRLTNISLPKESKPEALLEYFDGSGKPFLQILSDNGSTVFYNDNVKGKYLIPEFKKFRDDFIPLIQ